MALIADGLLIGTCLTTAIYCFVLSRRLRRLSNTEVGIGRQIKALNKALEDTRGALREIRVTAGGASESLARDVAAARRQAAQLARLIAKASERQAERPVMGYPAAPREATTDVPVAAAADTRPRARPPAGATYRAELNDAESTDDAAEMAADEILDDSTGEQQLGFLPDAAEPPEDLSELDLEFGAGDAAEAADEMDEADEMAGDSGGDDAKATDFPSEEAASRADGGPPMPADGNVLKVERMAL